MAHSLSKFESRLNITYMHNVHVCTNILLHVCYLVIGGPQVFEWLQGGHLVTLLIKCIYYVKSWYQQKYMLAYKQVNITYILPTCSAKHIPLLVDCKAPL